MARSPSPAALRRKMSRTTAASAVVDAALDVAVHAQVVVPEESPPGDMSRLRLARHRGRRSSRQFAADTRPHLRPCTKPTMLSPNVPNVKRLPSW